MRGRAGRGGASLRAGVPRVGRRTSGPLPSFCKTGAREAASAGLFVAETGSATGRSNHKEGSACCPTDGRKKPTSEEDQCKKKIQLVLEISGESEKNLFGPHEGVREHL